MKSVGGKEKIKKLRKLKCSALIWTRLEIVLLHRKVARAHLIL